MWAIARFDLRLTTEEFGRLTPKLYQALMRRLEAREQKFFMGHGIVASTVSNCAPFAAPGRKAADPTDFIPGFNKRKKESAAMSVQEQTQLLSTWWGCGPAQEAMKGEANAKKKKAT